MNKIRRIISVIAVLLILVSTAGQSAYAAEKDIENTGSENTETEPQEEAKGQGFTAAEAGSFLVEAESTDNFRYENGHLYIYGGTVSVETRPDTEYSTDMIEVSGYAVLILSGVRIKAENGAAIRILPGADAEVRLYAPEKNDEDEEEADTSSQRIDNYVEGAEGYAAIEAGTLPRGDGSSVLSASLRIKGEGSLTAVGGKGAAAIGGSRGQNTCGIIVIEEGNIEAVAGENADGIGCGADSSFKPLYAPLITDEVSSLVIMTGGTGKAVTEAAEKAAEETDEASEEAAEETEEASEEAAEETEEASEEAAEETEEASDEAVEEAEEEAEEPNEEEENAEDAGSSYPEGVTRATLLTATFADSGDESLAGLENVRVRDTNSNFEASFNMPAGYRSFAVKVEADREYMIEQGGRAFAAAQDEYSSGEIEEGDESAILFTGTTEYNEERIFLAPVRKTPAIDIEVRSEWQDEDDKDGTRPGSIMVTLYANGKETGRTITLSEENDWSGIFDELAVYSDSVRQSYSVVEERLDGYTGLICGSDREGYTITNRHEPLPEGRSSEEEIALRSQPVQEGVIVAKVLTTKISRTTPVRTSTTIRKSKSAKTADSSMPCLWGGILLAAVAVLFIWMRIEQKRDRSDKK